MKDLITNKKLISVTGIYFGVTAALAIAELFSSKSVIFFLKPFLIPILTLMYLSESDKKNQLYIWSLLFAWISNLLLLSAAREIVLYGVLAFMMYRFVSIIVIIRLIKKFLLLPFIVAALPFLFIFACLIHITVSMDAPEFYPTVFNGLLITVMAGISLSNYVLDDNKMHSWLAISTLLFVALVSLFLIQKYYISNVVFQPMSALIFAFAHFAFYKFVLAGERRVGGSDND